MSTETPHTEALATKEPRAEGRIGDQGIQIRSIEEGMRFAKYVVASGIAPKGDNEAAVFIKLQAGLEFGFSPMRALAAIVVVNGRVSLDGKATLALIRASGVCRKLRVYNEGEGDRRAGVMEFERADSGDADKVTFTLAEAKTAGLMGKDTYKGYPDDMLAWRAVARASRRYFSDVTMGLEVAEVARELPPVSVEPAPVVERTPPTVPDRLLAAATAGEHHAQADVEVPLDPPPFASNEEADKAIADAEGQGLLPGVPAKPRPRRD